ncbi:MAG: riboflavin synthase [Burkholderiales bacterium]|jgi:riboflavin synthase|nr:riboflavin synthase [Burkholderiales bacterium]
MFTGIITAVGAIKTVTPKAGGVALEVDASKLDLTDVALGDSIALNGCCLTVVAWETKTQTLAFDVSAETLRCTAGFPKGGRVNMEKAMRLSDRLGGHLVSGHVDGVGRIAQLKVLDAALGEENAERNYLLEIEAPETLMRFIAPKGSLTVNGVSLTVNTVVGNRVSINLIPHTFAATTFSSLKVGDAVNLEIDLIARYVAQLLSATVDVLKCGSAK